MQCQRLAYQGSRGAIAAPRWCQIDRRLGACSLNAMQGCWGGKEVEGSREATLVHLSDECGFYAVKCFGSVENWEACSEAGKDFRDTQRGPSTSELEALYSLCVWFFVLRSICHAECSIYWGNTFWRRRHQEKVWTFRDEKHQLGRGPAAAIGDADEYALGLGADEFEDATPRRRCILDSLSLQVPCSFSRLLFCLDMRDWCNL